MVLSLCGSLLTLPSPWYQIEAGLGPGSQVWVFLDLACHSCLKMYPVPAGWASDCHTFPYPSSLEVFAEAISGHLGEGRSYQKRLSLPVTGGGTWATMWLLSTRSITVLWTLGHVLCRASYTFLVLVNVLLLRTATQTCMTSQHPLRSSFTHGSKIPEHYYCPMLLLHLSKQPSFEKKMQLVYIVISGPCLIFLVQLSCCSLL